MKLFYFNHESYFENIFEACRHLGIENWEIGPEFVNTSSSNNNDEDKVKYKNPVIFSDDDRMRQRRTRVSNGTCIPMGYLIFSYNRFKDDVMRTIENGEDIVICLDFKLHEYCPIPKVFDGEIRHMDAIDSISWMVQLTDKIHLIFIVEENFPSDDYHELVNYISLLTKINVKSLSFVNICKVSGGNSIYTDEKISKMLLTNLQTLTKERKAFSKPDTQGVYLYDWQKNTYKLHPLVLKDIRFRQPNLSIDLAPTNGKEICAMLKEWRKKYAEEHNLNYKPRECNYPGVCSGSCNACEREANNLARDLYEDESNVSELTSLLSISADICKLSRFRYNTDGKGLRTLVMFNDCKLRCKNCANRSIINAAFNYRRMTVPELGFFYLGKDMLYFKINGGVTFGGGEPLLYADFIHTFHLMYPKISIDIETSLNISFESMAKIIDDIDEWFIDIKDMNNDIYKKYTGFSNELVKSNLAYLLNNTDKEKINIRVPHIAGYNTSEDVEKSVSELEKMGVVNIEVFTYESFA